MALTDDKRRVWSGTPTQVYFVFGCR